jgi:transposase InsO family protein
MEIASRRILHFNVAEHPTAQWTLQQFREALPWEHDYRYLIHDRDSIFSAALDESLRDLGLEILRTPPRSPKANAICERLIGTARRECVDHMIPLSERHLRRILLEWIEHYNTGRPHSALGPGLPQPLERPIPVQSHRHRWPERAVIDVKAVLGGLHHDYRLRPAPS